MLAFLSSVELSGAIHSVIIAHVVMCAPFAMSITRLRLSQMDPSLEAAAWNLGASEWQAMRNVIIPFCKPAIFASLMITMAVSFDEFAVSWFVSGLNETLPVKVLGFLQGQVSPRINVIGTFVFLTTMTLVILAQILLMKRSARPASGAPA
jgi:spermidine/putrescine transport system permease protein